MAASSSQTLFKFDAEGWRREPMPAFDAFLAGHRFRGRALRKSTFTIYKGMFERLLTWLQAYGMELHDLDATNLEGFLASRQLSPETRHRYLLVFTELYRHLALLRQEEANPAFELLTAQRAPDRMQPEALTPEETERLLAKLREQRTDKWKDLRLECMVVVLLDAALRSSELLSLRLKDVARGDSIWVAAQKPRPERTVPLSAFGRTSLKFWLAKREAMRIPGTLVFPGNDAGAPLSAATLFRQTQALLEAAGVSRRYEGPTLLRNTRAAAWLAEHHPLKVQPWLGHQHERTTLQLEECSQAWKGVRLLDVPLWGEQPEAAAQAA